MADQNRPTISLLPTSFLSLPFFLKCGKLHIQGCMRQPQRTAVPFVDGEKNDEKETLDTLYQPSYRRTVW
jgi:hypothetical protein